MDVSGDVFFTVANGVVTVEDPAPATGKADAKGKSITGGIEVDDGGFLVTCSYSGTFLKDLEGIVVAAGYDKLGGWTCTSKNPHVKSAKGTWLAEKVP